jgi:hypothetical protein
VESQSVVDGSYIFEVDGVGNFEAFHAVGVSPLLKMHLESPATPVAIITAYLTLVFDAQAMQLVEPVGNRFSVPP